MKKSKIEKKIKDTKITVLDYDEFNLREKRIEKVEECFPFKEAPTVSWINVEGLTKIDILRKLGDYFGMHHLVLEAILTPDQRPKMEDFGSYIYIVLKMARYDEKNHEINFEQVSLILASNFVISFQEGFEGDVFNPIRERIRSGKALIRKKGTDYLIYSLIDAICDNYFSVIEKIEERIGVLEEKLVESPTKETLHAIYGLKREIMFLWKSIWPLREVINSLEKTESPLIKKSNLIYFRDIYDHIIQTIETVEILRELLNGMRETYLSSISNKLNEIMKVLAIIATIFMPLTFLAGVYGMNFRYMPEIGWKWGYPLILLLMFLISLSMLFYFKKKKWL